MVSLSPHKDVPSEGAHFHHPAPAKLRSGERERERECVHCAVVTKSPEE